MLLFALSLLLPQAAEPAPNDSRTDTISVTVAGSGQPVVLIPGLFGGAHAYRHVIQLLEEHDYQTIAIEPLGIGNSTRPKDADYSLTAQADRIGAVLDTLGTEGAVVVAHALGGSIALRLAHRRPDLVSSVISLEGGPAEAATTSAFRRWLGLAPLGKLFNAEALMQRMVHRDLVRVSADTTWINEELVRAYLAGDLLDIDATLDAYRGMARSEEPVTLSEQLSGITQPVALLLGGAEHRGGPSAEERALLDARLPRFTEYRIDDVGHFIQEERPSAVVQAIIRATRSDRDENSARQ